MITQNLKILVIIPAYNEEKNIKEVIEDLCSAQIDFDIAVINDCSTDETEKKARGLNVKYVINLPINLGIGGAVQTGFKLAMMKDYDIALQFDGDAQHIAAEISKLIKPIVDNNADVVIGSRFLEKPYKFKSSFFRSLGIKYFMFINSFLINKNVYDNTSGFRAYNRKAIKFLAEYYPLDYPEPEAIILLSKNNFRIEEVAVEMKKRNFGRSSIFGFTSIYYIIKVTISILINYIRPKIKHF